MKKGFFGTISLVLLMIYSCTNNPAQDKNVIDRKYSVTLLNGNYKIDTLAILKNQNLAYLINDLENQTLHQKKTLAEMPKLFKSFLKNLNKDFSIANPGEEWKVGCCESFELNPKPEVIIDSITGKKIIVNVYREKKIPTRQLSYFGMGKNIAMMTHYTGGIGKSEWILLFKFEKNKIIDFWCDTFPMDLEKKKDIIKYLRKIKSKSERFSTSNIYF